MYAYNEFDHYITDFRRYRYFFHLITGKYLRFHEWYEIYQFLTKPRPKQVVVTIKDIKLIRDLFDDVHQPLCGPLANIDTIHRAEWAHSISLITADELDQVKRIWRQTC